ncbi:MAG: exo-alpha-sialidase [Planctomycetales bacterium]|nr:exo-alpha-sialidase [Planctomycetales bacterium]
MIRNAFAFYACLVALQLTSFAVAETPEFESSLVFPLNPEHNHAPGIVECPNGDMLVSWYRGSGERKSDDVAVYGARKRANSDEWSQPFLMADTVGFPDCNTCMMIDSQQRLRLFWPVILANTWESCLTNVRTAYSYQEDGSPSWDQHMTMLLKPADFQQQALQVLDEKLKEHPDMSDGLKEEIKTIKTRLGDKLYQRLGWQPRCKPTVLPSGRILLPLYTDTFSISIMAVSDDGGDSWYASAPLIGFGNIQPTVLRKKNGTLVAYMRENGPTDHILQCESSDDGLTWGPVTQTKLLNPGAGVDGVVLANGHWLLVYNDSFQHRSNLAVSISTDEGQSWTKTRYVEKHETGSYHYPAVIQGKDESIHLIYSYFVEGGKSMKYCRFNEAWVTAQSE